MTKPGDESTLGPSPTASEPSAGERRPSKGTLDEALRRKIESLPQRPGCYVFRDSGGGALYVGKATNLRARVRSYFKDSSGDLRAFIPWLRRNVGDLETVVTASEKEAAVLENNLIKEYHPRYNVKLRDDKEFLSLRLDPTEPWPRLDLVRRPRSDHARYFGPYPSATAARRTLRVAERHFQLRTCSDRELASRRRPCIQYDIKRCPAPCVFEVDRDAYGAQVGAVTLFLQGRQDELTKLLQERMKTASAAMDFESAAALRDQLNSIRAVHEQQRVVAVSDLDQDVLGLHRERQQIQLILMPVRHGRVVDVLRFSENRVDVDDSEVVGAFLRQYYGPGGSGCAAIPDEILVPTMPDASDGVQAWLDDVRHSGGSRRGCKLLEPQRGPRHKLLELALDNARHAFEEQRREAEQVQHRLERVQARLRLPRLPERVECVDISHLGGLDTVGAFVALHQGRPDRRRYRTYNVKTVEGGDDYGALREVLKRRFVRGARAREASVGDAGNDELDQDRDWELPDLLVIDGGRGQLAVALTAAQDLGLSDLAIVGLAKEKETPLGQKLVDRVYLPGQKNPILLGPGSPELFLLGMARDEAHRFSNRARERVGKKRRMGSVLDELPGIGPKTRRALLTHFASVDAIRAATEQELRQVPGVNARVLRALLEGLAEAPDQPEEG